MTRPTWILAGLSALIAAGLGLWVQRALGAPASGLAVQGAGLMLGVLAAAMLVRRRAAPSERVLLTLLVAGLAAVMAPLVLGPEIDGARRWLTLGPLTIQPAMIALPLIVWAVSCGRPTRVKSGLVLACGVALAVGFDAAALSALALGWTASLSMRPRRGSDLAVAGGLAALVAWVWTRPDVLPSVAYVEDVLPNAWAISPLLGFTAAAGVVLSVAPLALVVRRHGPAFGLLAMHLGLVGSAMAGNYPMPVIGMGASLALGWLLAIGLAMRQAAYGRAWDRPSARS